MTKYCYIEPDFPKKIYIALAFIKTKESALLYPLFEIFYDLKKLSAKMKKLKKKVEKKNEDTDVYGGMVLTLKYHHNFPLKKEYWQVPHSPNLNKDIRTMAFLEMFKDAYQFYWVLITPVFFDIKTKTWKFTSWLPVLITSTDKQIGALIKSSDQSVDYKAKSIGLYSVVKMQGLTIESGKLNEPNERVGVFEANC